MDFSADNNNFWWGIELEAEGGEAEESLFTVADLSGSVGSVVVEEKGSLVVLRSAYVASFDVSYWLDVINAILKDFPGVRVRAHAKIENKSWHTEHLEAFPPLAIGNGLVVAAPWHKGSETEAAILSSRLPVYIYPSSAFGTGYHESTQIALSLVERYIKAGDVILDLGTGSGILFIAGLKLGAVRATARDIDPVAITEAKRNMDFNNIPYEICNLQSGDLFEWLEELDGAEKAAVQADLLTSNILLAPNTQLLGGLENVLKPSGVAIFSGMTEKEKPVFLAGLTGAGLAVDAELVINDWWGCAVKWK